MGDVIKVKRQPVEVVRVVSEDTPNQRNDAIAKAITAALEIAAADATTKADAAQAASQPHDSGLDAVAAIDSSTPGALVTDGAGWISKTYAQLKTALGLTKADVGLGNTNNTADIDKPISTAQQAALDTKLALAGGTMTGDLSLGSHKVTAAADATTNTGLVTLQQVNALIAAMQNALAGGDVADTLQTLRNLINSDETGISSILAELATKLTASNNLADLTDIAAAWANLGLGSAASHSASDFDATGAATAAQSAAQSAAATYTDARVAANALTIVDNGDGTVSFYIGGVLTITDNGDESLSLDSVGGALSVADNGNETWALTPGPTVTITDNSDGTVGITA